MGESGREGREPTPIAQALARRSLLDRHIFEELAAGRGNLAAEMTPVAPGTLRRLAEGIDQILTGSLTPALERDILGDRTRDYLQERVRIRSNDVATAGSEAVIAITAQPAGAAAEMYRLTARAAQEVARQRGTRITPDFLVDDDTYSEVVRSAFSPKDFAAPLIADAIAITTEQAGHLLADTTRRSVRKSQAVQHRNTLRNDLYGVAAHRVNRIWGQDGLSQLPLSVRSQINRFRRRGS